MNTTIQLQKMATTRTAPKYGEEKHSNYTFGQNRARYGSSYHESVCSCIITVNNLNYYDLLNCLAVESYNLSGDNNFNQIVPQISQLVHTSARQTQIV